MDRAFPVLAAGVAAPAPPALAVSRYHGNGERCPQCRLTYGRFRTGLSYADVYHLIWERPYKRRHGVLGAWHQIKRQMWRDHLEHCGQICPDVSISFDPADFRD